MIDKLAELNCFFPNKLAIFYALEQQHRQVDKSELVAEVCVQSYNAVLLVALRSDVQHRNQLYLEIQDLLINYLRPHVSERAATYVQVDQQVAAITQQHGLNPRQQAALAHTLKCGSLTIQAFESICPQPSSRTLQRDLKQLVAKGLLRSEGDTNQLIYWPMS
ncbi:MAG: hypothetical protein AAF152_02240 [Cyanobacteria bacterium P01_A01_bin.114]